MGRFQEDQMDRSFIASLNGKEQIPTRKAAELLGVSQKTVIRWCREKNLVTKRMNPNGRKILIPKETVIALYRGMGEAR